MEIEISSIFRFFLDLIYPNHCLVCQMLLLRTSGSICSSCQNEFESTQLGNWIGGVTNSEWVDRAYSGWCFNHDIQQIIHSLKYEDRAKLGFELGHMLGQELTISDVGEMDLLIPVPLHAVKKRERGYNQAEWIMKGLAEVWQIPYDSRLLKRKKYTVSQTTLNSEDRLINMEDAFQVLKPVTGMMIGIIDDVLTTGSTISACASVLKMRGANSVTAITCSTPKV